MDLISVRIISLAFCLIICLTACESEPVAPARQVRLAIRLTDAPASYDEVNIDLDQVLIKMKSDTGFVPLATNQGIYNLLELTGGADTLIVNDSVPAGEIQQLRLILGSNNTVVVGGISYPMDTPSAQQSGLKINLNKVLIQDSINDVLIDFDANASVVEKGNGDYSLKPVLRLVP